MSQHFGHHISLSIEGVELHSFEKEEVGKFYNSKERSATVDQNLSIQHFCSYFSDVSLQNATSTNYNMDIFLEALMKKNILDYMQYFFAIMMDVPNSTCEL